MHISRNCCIAGGLICGILLGNGYGPVDTLNNITINLPDIANTFDPTDTVDVMNTNDDNDETTVTAMNENNVMRRSFDFETQLDEWERLAEDGEGKSVRDLSLRVQSVQTLSSFGIRLPS